MFNEFYLYQVRHFIYHSKKTVSILQSQNICGGVIYLNVSALNIYDLLPSFITLIPKKYGPCGRDIVFLKFIITICYTNILNTIQN